MGHRYNNFRSFLSYAGGRGAHTRTVVAVGATVGMLIGAMSFVLAATSSISFEAEQGTLSNASVTTDSTASDGSAIEFISGNSGTYSFQSSGLTGGGFQNVIAISPFKDGAGVRPYLIGADVSGVHRSTTQGKKWEPVPSPDHVASLLWSDTTPGKAYVAADEGFHVSTDWGQTWSKKAGAVDFDANGTYFASGSEHPRPTGNLIAQDNSGATKYIWVATATQGVKQSTNEGASWNATTLVGDHLRAIASDPNNPDILYVAIRNTDTARNGIWRSTNARSTSMSFTKMSGYTSTTPEELWAINDNGTTRLYAASAKDGVFVLTGTNWAAINNGLDTGTTGSTYQAITGYRDGAGNIILYTGATAAKTVSGTQHRRAIMKSVNGGSSWTSISGGSNMTVDWNEYGTSVTSWLKDLSYHNFAGNAQWTASQIVIDPDFTNIVLVSGRGGAWVGTQSGTATKWQPGNNGLMVTVNMSVAVDPNVAGRVVDGNMDYTALFSTNSGESFKIAGAADAGAASTGDVVVFDSVAAANGAQTTLYLGASQRGQNTGNGKVFSNANIFNNGAWVDENLPVNTDVPALSVGRDNNNQRVILAGTTQLGFWRKVGANWSEITGGPWERGSSGFGYFAWKPNSAIVYAFDPTGVWRSNSAGSQGSWVKILAGSAEYGTLNSLVLDSQNPNILYVSDGAVKRITNAETTTGTGATTVSTIGSMTNAGPIVMSNAGHLFVHDRSGRQLLRSTDPRAGSPSFAKVSDLFYTNNNGNIRSMAIDRAGTIYTAENGKGVTVGTP